MALILTNGWLLSPGREGGPRAWGRGSIALLVARGGQMDLQLPALRS